MSVRRRCAAAAGALACSTVAFEAAAAEPTAAPAASAKATLKPAPESCKASTTDEDNSRRLTSAKDLNEIVREIWSIEEETLSGGRRTNLAAGVFAGPAFFKPDEDVEVEVRVLAGPVAFFQANLFENAGAVSLIAIDRAKARLDRILGYDLIATQKRIHAEIAEVEKIRSAQADSLKKVSAEINAPPPPPQPPPPATKAATEAASAGVPVPSTEPGAPGLRAGDERLKYLNALKADIERQQADTEERLRQLCEAGAQTKVWSDYADWMVDRVDSRRSGFLGVGLQAMFGYGFDVASNPSDGRTYSGVVGGIGFSALLNGFGTGVGIMVQEDGLIGGYLSFSSALIN